MRNLWRTTYLKIQCASSYESKSIKKRNKALAILQATLVIVNQTIAWISCSGPFKTYSKLVTPVLVNACYSESVSSIPWEFTLTGVHYSTDIVCDWLAASALSLVFQISVQRPSISASIKDYFHYRHQRCGLQVVYLRRGMYTIHLSHHHSLFQWNCALLYPQLVCTSIQVSFHHYF